jgi:HPt (histidine-containing phosphotransfer) domain-containing protein
MTFHADVPQHAEMAARLAPIRAHFVSTLADRQVRLSAFLSSNADRSTDQAALRALQEDAHKIRGVALTLGFEALGKIASRVDELLDASVVPAASDPHLRQELADFLSEIEQTMASHARG